MGLGAGCAGFFARCFFAVMYMDARTYQKKELF